MAYSFSLHALHFFALSVLALLTTNPSICIDLGDEYSIIGYGFDAFHGDYTPPAPPPPSQPQHPPSLTCEDDLFGTGSLNTTCLLNSSIDFIDDVYIEGNGSLDIGPGVNLSCPVLGCSITVNMSGGFSLGSYSVIVAGSVSVSAWNASLFEGSIINVTTLAGVPPAQTSGTPMGCRALVEGTAGGVRAVCRITQSFRMMCGAGMLTRGHHWMHR
jgi:hypothetical protein